MIDTGPDGVFPGDLNGPRVDIRGKNMIFPGILRRDGGGSGLLPESGIEKGPVLRRKTAVKSGGAVQRGERRLNGDGPAGR